MSDKQSIQDALRQAGAPDYMVLIITKIVSAEDAIREMQATLSSESVSQRQSQQVLDERQAAFLKAAQDMTDFANRLYGPESELSKVNQKLETLESTASTRDNQIEKLVRGIEDRVTKLEQRKSA